MSSFARRRVWRASDGSSSPGICTLGKIGIISLLVRSGLLLACGERAAEDPVIRTDAVAPSGRVGTKSGGGRALGDRDFVGVVIAREQLRVVAKQSGEVVDVRVHLGDHVKAGDTLVRIDDRPFRETLAMTRAELAAAEAEFARSRIDLAEAEDRRRRTSALQGNIPQEEIATAGFAVERAIATRELAQAQVARLRVRVAQLERDLSETKITAPFSAAVALRLVEPGAMVQSGSPLIRLIPEGPPWVRFAVPVAEAADIVPGRSVAIRVESIERPLSGTVRKIAPEVDPNSRMLWAEAELAAPRESIEKIRSGTAAWVLRF